MDGRHIGVAFAVMSILEWVYIVLYDFISEIYTK